MLPSEPPRSEDEEGFLQVHAPAVVPFEPNDPDLIHARERTRRALRTLRAGELLHGVIEGHARRID